MRKIAIILVVVFFFATFSLPFFNQAENVELNGSFSFVLPASLSVIEDEAFVGTGMKDALLPESLITIGESAFADNQKLRKIVIPKSVYYIGDRAFEASSGVTIYGEAGSYVARWAMEHNIAFVRLDGTLAWISALKKLLEVICCSIIPLNIVYENVSLWKRRWAVFPLLSMRPQDRIELYPINYRFP